MKRITSLWIIMILSLFSFTANAQIYFDLMTSGGSKTMGYDDVNTEQAKAVDTRWINVTSFPSANTSGRCSSVASTFNMTNTRTIEFWLAKCDNMIINANIATGRGITYSIDGGTAVTLNGTNACNDFSVAINKEVPCKIKITGLNSSSAYVSLFTFTYAPKVPSIKDFSIIGINANINQETKNISLVMPYGTDITSVTPAVTLGGIATSYSPSGPQNFTTGAIEYTATDGTSEVKYTANITVKATPDTEKAITSLTINGKVATINEATGAITCEFPSFTSSLGNWPVVFTLNTITGSANYVSGTSYDFSSGNPLNITVTAQDFSTKLYTVTPSISTKKNIGMLTLNGKAELYDNVLLSAFNDYYVSFLMADAVAPADINAFYSNYDLIVLHSNVAGANATGVASKNMVGVKPVLNLKVFFYSSGRWSWSTAAPQNSTAGISSVNVETNLKSHPIFSNVTFTDNTLALYDNLPAANTNAIQCASDLATIGNFVSHTIATMNTTGIQMHEIQGNLAAKYLLVGISMENNNFNYLNSNAVNILKNAAAYLLNPTVKHNFTSTGLLDAGQNSGLYYSNGTIYNPGGHTITIYNASGMRVKTSDNASIDTQSLAKGVYIVQPDNMKVLKFIR